MGGSLTKISIVASSQISASFFFLRNGLQRFVSFYQYATRQWELLGVSDNNIKRWGLRICRFDPIYSAILFLVNIVTRSK